MTNDGYAEPEPEDQWVAGRSDGRQHIKEFTKGDVVVIRYQDGRQYEYVVDDVAHDHARGLQVTLLRNGRVG